MKKLIFILGILLPIIVIAQDQTINGNIQINASNMGGIRIGKIGDGGQTNVPIGGISAQYNIDFSGYRDVSRDQIGARISAIRYNRYIEGKSYIQNTALVFYTNPIGGLAGATELVERMRINPEGNIGIGISSPKNKLEVNGTIRAKEVKIEATGWADFVFAPDYNLQSLNTVEAHINEYGRLPNIPSESEVKENRVDVGEMQIKLLQKIEELTLYTIQQQKQLEEQNKQIQELQQLVKNK